MRIRAILILATIPAFIIGAPLSALAQSGGMHQILMQSKPAQSSGKKAPDTEEMQAIWAHYQKLVPPAPNAPTVKSLNKQSAPEEKKAKKANPAGMAMIMQQYKKNKEGERTMKTLSFQPPKQEENK